MKIAVISTPVFRIIPPQGTYGYSGLEVIAYQCAKGLAEKGHEVFLAAPDGSTCPGVTIWSVGPERQVDERMAYDRYWKELLKVDVVICHDWQKYAYLLKAEGVLKAPVLGVIHAPVNTCFQSLPPVSKPCFVCISDDQRYHFEGLFGRPARTCYNGCDTGFYSQMDVPRTDRFLFLARFSSIKGGDLGIEACRRTGAFLDLVGDLSITNEPDYFEKCRSLCDGKKIRMVGPASRGETVYWYSQAKAMLHPNQRFREPFGLAPVEAMLCGLPVIAYNYGAMRETVKHGETGFLVDSLEEMTELIKTDAVSGLSRARCREWASQFSLQRMVDRYEELCIEALGGGW